jgi:hypothetical protein
MSGSGFTLDEWQPPREPEGVWCAGLFFAVYDGVIRGVERLDDHTCWALVMAPPLLSVVSVDLDRHPEHATANLGFGHTLLGRG